MALGPALAGRPFRVELVEARAQDPAVPQGKAFAQVRLADMGFQGAGTCGDPPYTLNPGL